MDRAKPISARTNALSNFAGISVNTTGGGWLRFESSQSPATAFTITVNSGGRLDSYGTRTYGANLGLHLNGGILEANASAASTATWNGPVQVSGAASVVANRRIDFFGAVSGTGTITKTGGDVLNFRGGVSSLGGLTINAGRVRFEGTGFGAWTGPITVSTGGILSPWASHSTAANINLNGGTLSIENSGTATYSGNVTVNNASVIDAGINLGVALGVTLGGSISGSANLTVSGGGTTTLTGNNSSYSGGIAVNAGTLLVSNTSGSGTGSGPVNLSNAGTTLSGTGTIGGTLTANGGTIVAPGATAAGGTIGTLTVGNLVLQNGATYQADVASATSNDRIKATGTVSIVSGANLVASGSLVTPSGGRLITLISNGSGAAVGGTFTSLPEGTLVSTIGGDNLAISYVGGAGNDVVLYNRANGVAVTDGTANADVFELRRKGTGVAGDVVQLLAGFVPVDTRPLSAVGSGWTVNAGDGADSLLVNYGHSGGFFNVPVNFNGEGPASSSSPDDVLAIAGGTFTTVTHDYTLPASGTTQKGTITYTTSSLGSDVITYTGVGSVNMAASTDTDPSTPAPPEPGLSVIGSLTFTLPGTGDLAALEDDGAANTVSQIRSLAASPTFAATMFPRAAVIVNMGGDSGLLRVTLPDLNHSLTINGQAGTDAVNFSGISNLTALAVNVSGAISDNSGTTLAVSGQASLTGSSITLGDSLAPTRPTSAVSRSTSPAP